MYVSAGMPPDDSLPLTARTFGRTVMPGVAGLAAWEFIARFVAPPWLGHPLDLTPLIDMAIGFSGMAAQVLHLLTGLVLFPLGYVFVVRPIAARFSPGLSWPMLGLGYGVTLWVLAMYGVVGVVGGMPLFLGFEPAAWASLAGHFGLGLGIAAVVSIPLGGVIRRALILGSALSLAAAAAPAAAQPANGLVTRPSAHPVRATLDRFAMAVREAGWVVFAEVDHAAAARDVGMALRMRTVVLFGNPRAGTPGMMANPTLAIDLPMRVLVWEDDQDRTFITRSTGEDIAERVFARHGVTIPPEARRGTDSFIENLVRKAAE